MYIVNYQQHPADTFKLSKGRKRMNKEEAWRRAEEKAHHWHASTDPWVRVPGYHVPTEKGYDVWVYAAEGSKPYLACSFYVVEVKE